jgi:hypothetical protein
LSVLPERTNNPRNPQGGTLSRGPESLPAPADRFVVIRLGFVERFAMSEAMQSIVDAYVGLENRFALEEMRRHRQELKNEIRMRSGQGFDFGLSLRTIDEDLSAIEDGITRLQS